MDSKQFDSAGKVRVVARIRGFSSCEAKSEPGASRTGDWVSVNRGSLDDVSISFGDQSRYCLRFELRGFCICELGEHASYPHIATLLRTRYLVDYCYKVDEDSEMIYSREVKPLVSAAFEGHNSTVIAHGARGSGKTHTIQGSAERPGLAGLAIVEFLSLAEKNGKSIAVSFYEVDHQERAMDLLNQEKPPILVLEDHGRIQFKGLTQIPVKSIAEFQNLYTTACFTLKGAPKKGGSERVQRSHMGLIVHVFSRNESVGSTVSKMNFVDLAASRSCHWIHRASLDSTKKSVSSTKQMVNSHMKQIPKSVSRTAKKLHGSSKLLEKNVVAKKSAMKGRTLFDEAGHCASEVDKEISVHVTQASKPLMDNSSSDTGNHVLLNSGMEKDDSSSLNVSRGGDNVLAAQHILVDEEKEHTLVSNCSEALSIIVQEEDYDMNKENSSKAIGDVLSPISSPPISSQLRDLSNSLKMLCSSNSSCRQISENEPIPLDIVEPKTPIIEQNMSINRGDGINVKSPWETFSMRGSGMKTSLVQEYLRFLNTADKEELKRLKGIGEKRATFILELREESPEPFKSLDDLKDIGLSAKQYEIIEYVSLTVFLHFLADSSSRQTISVPFPAASPILALPLRVGALSTSSFPSSDLDIRFQLFNQGSGLEMPSAKLKASSTPDVMKTEDSIDALIKQTIGKDPFDYFPWVEGSSLPWLRLIHALDPQGVNNSFFLREKLNTFDLLTISSWWTFLPPMEIQLQKCDKCSRQFCSPINYRRHIRVHHRLKKLDKDFTKTRDLLGAYWDKLSVAELKEVVSFENVMLEEVPGSSILKSLTTLVQNQRLYSFPPYYVMAGAALLDIVQYESSVFPISSQQLFNILDDASEKTCLCGTVESVQRYVFDGEAGKVSLEPKNIVACTSFLLEQILYELLFTKVKACLIDKEAEALRCQKQLVEEEEAAQRRQAEILERKRQKKLRQKEQKAREQRHKAEAEISGIDSTAKALSLAEASLDTYNSEAHNTNTFSDNVASSVPLQYPDTNEEINKDTHLEYDTVTDQNLERQSAHGDIHHCLAVSRQQGMSKSQRAESNDLHTNQNSPLTKLEVNQKYGSQGDKKVSAVGGSKTRSGKSKTKINKVVLKTTQEKEPDQVKNEEVFIGSVPVNVGNCTQSEGNTVASQKDSIVENVGKQKSSPGKPMKTDLATGGNNRSTDKVWKPISQLESKNVLPVQSGGTEADAFHGNSQNWSGPSCSRVGSTDGGDIGCEKHLSHAEGSVDAGSFQSIVQAAKAFFRQRWIEAMSSEHETLVITSDSESSGSQ
ncbi:unnamed protein product [Sphenostylis stenocarpa]|uniref:C2H2-type domain-containing protein n=1 Tax=Sphenostylis stenocarpa TaxID=92480 RepID=A0AA86VD29_9FABA|nr:unnamed protein product [Sphenostylis stenocarpa]